MAQPFETPLDNLIERDATVDELVELLTDKFRSSIGQFIDKELDELEKNPSPQRCADLQQLINDVHTNAVNVLDEFY